MPTVRKMTPSEPTVIARLEITARESLFQLLAATSERRPSFRHELSTPGGVVGPIFPIAAEPY